VIYSREIRRERQLALTGEMIHEYKLWSVNLKGRNYSEDLGVCGKVILEWILKN
jgi:hypothetical protein